MNWLLRKAWWLVTGFILFFSGVSAVATFSPDPRFTGLSLMYSSGLPWIYVALPIWLVLSAFQRKRKRRSSLEAFE